VGFFLDERYVFGDHSGIRLVLSSSNFFFDGFFFTQRPTVSFP